MTTETITWLWLIAGLVLMISELAIPGLVVVFLGLAAVLIALARWFGLIDNLLDSFTYWFILTVVIILALRGLVARYFSGDVSVTRTSEDEEAVGRIVKVIEEVGSDHDLGRVQFRGTTWKAKSEFGKAFPGQKVKIVGRDNLIWIVDPLENNEEYHVPIDSLAKKSAKKFRIGAKKSKDFNKRN